MSIAGINGYNYSNYYTGIKRNTAKANGMNSGLLSNVSSTSSNITLHMYSMGMNKFQTLAKDAGAILKIDRMVLVDLDVFDQYLESFRVR